MEPFFIPSGEHLCPALFPPHKLDDLHHDSRLHHPAENKIIVRDY